MLDSPFVLIGVTGDALPCDDPGRQHHTRCAQTYSPCQRSASMRTGRGIRHDSAGSLCSIRRRSKAHQSKNPRRQGRRGFSTWQIKSLAVTYFRIDNIDTSIGAERFHFRVRKGIGWFPLAIAARQTCCDRGGPHGPPRARIRAICFRQSSHSIHHGSTPHDPPTSGQIAWVLYGQASRAISTG